MADPVAAIEREARGRHARWNPALWQALLAGPGPRLAASLADAPAAHAEAVLGSWLRLAAEGVGLGLLSASSPAPNVPSLLLLEVVPAQLASLPEAARLPALAQAWNLGEALEGEPGWKRALFLRLCRDVRLEELSALVSRVEERASAAPSAVLGDAVRVTWVHLAADDPRFLPGGLHFVAPTVCCVHDRLRDDGVALGVWLDDDVVLLGSTGCRETVGAGRDLPLEKLAEAADVRVADVVAASRNAHRGGIALEASQFLVAVLPA